MSRPPAFSRSFLVSFQHSYNFLHSFPFENTNSAVPCWSLSLPVSPAARRPSPTVERFCRRRRGCTQRRWSAAARRASQRSRPSSSAMRRVAVRPSGRAEPGSRPTRPSNSPNAAQRSADSGHLILLQLLAPPHAAPSDLSGEATDAAWRDSDSGGSERGAVSRIAHVRMLTLRFSPLFGSARLLCLPWSIVLTACGRRCAARLLQLAMTPPAASTTPF